MFWIYWVLFSLFLIYMWRTAVSLFFFSFGKKGCFFRSVTKTQGLNSPVTFFPTNIFLMVFCNVCNRYSSGLILTDLEIYKKNFCIGKQIAKKVTWWEPCKTMYRLIQNWTQKHLEETENTKANQNHAGTHDRKLKPDKFQEWQANEGETHCI